MITSKIPENWQNLQIEVARILMESGFEVEVEKSVASSRGIIEIDVYAKEVVKGRKYSIACECKHWKSKIPQSVIHGFRTVVTEIGANVGYVVSLNGFQSGAYTASDLTNLELVTWEQFQNIFLESWYEGYFSPEVAHKLDALMTYSEPFLPKWFSSMSDSDKDAYISLKNKYDVFGMLMQSFGPWSRLFQKEKIPSLPLINRLTPDPERDTIPSIILQEKYYREFLEEAIRYGEAAIAEFHQFRDKYKT